MKKITLKKLIVTYLRITAILSIVFNLGTTFYVLFIKDIDPEEYVNVELSIQVLLLISSVVVLISTYLTSYIERKLKFFLPDILSIVILVFIYAGLVLSVRYDLYYTYHWWDDLLHTIAGVIFASVAFLMLFKLNNKYSFNFNPLLIAMFTFSFAVTMGVFWEILEFTSDVLFGTDHQKWSLPDDATLIGKPYQGTGLRDTMSDLIVTCVGAFVSSVVFYFLYKNHKEYVSKTVSKVIKEEVNVNRLNSNKPQ